MQVLHVLGSSLHLCLKAGQLSVVTITRRCRCCLDELIKHHVDQKVNTVWINLAKKYTSYCFDVYFYFILGMKEVSLGHDSHTSLASSKHRQS